MSSVFEQFGGRHKGLCISNINYRARHCLGKRIA